MRAPADELAPQAGWPCRWPSSPSCVARPWGWRPGLWEPAGQTDTDSLWFRERRPHPLGSPCIQVGRALEPALTRGTREESTMVAAVTAQPESVQTGRCVAVDSSRWHWGVDNGDGRAVACNSEEARLGGWGGWAQPGHPGVPRPARHGHCGERGVDRSPGQGAPRTIHPDSRRPQAALPGGPGGVPRTSSPGKGGERESLWLLTL